MKTDKSQPPTKTVAFRLPTWIVDQINKSAKEKELTFQEYFLMQLLPGSELGQMIATEQSRILSESEGIAKAKEAMVQDAMRIQETLGISEDQLIEGVGEALKLLLKGNKK